MENRRVLTIPVLCFGFYLVYFAYWVQVSFWLYSTGKEVHDKSLPFLKLQIAGNLKKLLVVHAFNLILFYILLTTLSKFLIGFMTCYWYFKDQTAGSRSYPLMKSVWITFRYHFGSLFLSSIIYSLFLIPKIIIEYVKVT